jgi:hypothetical protein
MTTEQLNVLSLAELKDLSARLHEVIQVKMFEQTVLNKASLRVGQTVCYIGNSKKIRGGIFEIKMLNRTNAVCKSVSTGEQWNIKIANLKAI